jgi:hypothetical protein
MNNDAAALLAVSAADLSTFVAPPASAADSSAVSPYDVAHALRATVARDGTIDAKALFVAYEAINRAVFGGALPPATLLWTAPGSPRTYADHISVDEHGIRFRIRVSPSIRKYGLRFVLDVVMHEMVHVACSYLDHDNEPGYRGHGPKFAARCNAIGALLGLAEVAAKGKRSGKPDCAQWPLNVRPLGYYGENDPRTVKTKAPDQGEESDDGAKPEAKPSRAARYEKAMAEASQLIDAGEPAAARAVLAVAME